MDKVLFCEAIFSNDGYKLGYDLSHSTFGTSDDSYQNQFANWIGLSWSQGSEKTAAVLKREKEDEFRRYKDYIRTKPETPDFERQEFERQRLLTQQKDKEEKDQLQREAEELKQQQAQYQKDIESQAAQNKKKLEKKDSVSTEITTTSPFDFFIKRIWSGAAAVKRWSGSFLEKATELLDNFSRFWNFQPKQTR